MTMQRLDIDFAAPSLARALRRSGWPVWAMAAAGLALCLAAWLTWQQGADERAALLEQIASADARAAARQTRLVPQPRVWLADEQAIAVNAIIVQLNRPWAEMLDAVALAGTPSVGLLELSPDPKGHRVKGIAEARNPAAMTAYIERLKRQPVFDQAHLSRHEFADQDSSQPLRFEFELRWPEVAP